MNNIADYPQIIQFHINDQFINFKFIYKYEYFYEIPYKQHSYHKFELSNYTRYNMTFIFLINAMTFTL